MFNWGNYRGYVVITVFSDSGKENGDDHLRFWGLGFRGFVFV